MKILLFSSLLALAAANVLLDDQSANTDGQRPGMCFEDFFKKYPNELKKFRNKMTESPDEPSDTKKKQHGHLNPNQEGPHPHDGHGHHPHQKPWHVMDFSKLRNCSVDEDCSGTDKCCRTMCGQRCIRPMFENKMMEHPEQLPEDHSHSDSDAEHEEKDPEEQPREKRQASSESAESSEELSEEEAGQEAQKEKSRDHGWGGGKAKGGDKGGENWTGW